MGKTIVVIDDDQDDLDLIDSIKDTFEIDVDFKFFTETDKLFDYLTQSKVAPLFILCDINMPSNDGFQLRKKMLENKEIRYKSVPFIFWSTSASEQQVRQAYDNLAQGFFDKPSSVGELREIITQLLKYWLKSRHPKKIE